MVAYKLRSNMDATEYKHVVLGKPVLYNFHRILNADTQGLNISFENCFCENENNEIIPVGKEIEAKYKAANIL